MPRMNTKRTKRLAAAVAALALLPGILNAMNHIYKGHYASGSAAWTFDGTHIYRGHYASGSAAFTYEKGHLYEGHYASGSAAFPQAGSSSAREAGAARRHTCRRVAGRIFIRIDEDRHDDAYIGVAGPAGEAEACGDHERKHPRDIYSRRGGG